MQKLILTGLFAILILSAFVMVPANASKGFVNNQNTKTSHYAMSQIGKSKVCGDHMCTPFEHARLQKELDTNQRNNQAGHFIKQTSHNATQVKQK